MAAQYFDGVSSRAHAVRLAVSNGMLVVSGDGFERRVAAADVAVSEPDATRRRVLQLRGGGSVEADKLVKDFLGRPHSFAAFEAWLNQKG